MSDAPKFPDVEVQLSGEDGNTLMIIARVSRALRKGGADKEAVNAFRAEAISGDYQHVLDTCDAYVTVL